MKKILVMPFLNIPSGHHQVADAISEWIQYVDSSAVFDKVDIIEYSYGNLVSIVAACYVNLIRLFPKTYSYIYHKLVYNRKQHEKRYRFYEWLFLNDMSKLMKEKQPDFVICTHALPSYLANQLKLARKLSIPIVNVYTDLFINDMWGIQGIDYHLVPNLHLKQWLITKGVKNDHIFVTGIPVHPKITKSKKQENTTDSIIRVLVTSGSLGIGSTLSFIKNSARNEKIQYKVLCGRNERLYKYLLKMNNPRITPLPYIKSRDEMNRLYDEVDIIVTKAGGVTISESLIKKIPIIVYDTLPGQEEINLQYLKHMGLIYDLKNWSKIGSPEDEILSMLDSKITLEQLFEKMDEYSKQLPDSDLMCTLAYILKTTMRSEMA